MTAPMNRLFRRLGFGAVGHPQRGNAEHRLGVHAERLA